MNRHFRRQVQGIIPAQRIHPKGPRHQPEAFLAFERAPILATAAFEGRRAAAEAVCQGFASAMEEASEFISRHCVLEG